MTYSKEIKGSVWTLYRLNYTFRAIIATINAIFHKKVSLWYVQCTVNEFLSLLDKDYNEDDLTEYGIEASVD